jgi:hypothetical protein
MPAPVLLLSDLRPTFIARFLLRFGLELRLVPNEEPIPASYWGESEAGLRGSVLLARLDTPIHSILHEASHFICMGPERRTGLLKDAGGDDAEENAVCYLQVLLAMKLPGVGKQRLFQDMDAWGYSFRLGSARAWFEQDAEDARQWLLRAGIIDADSRVTGQLRA